MIMSTQWLLTCNIRLFQVLPTSRTPSFEKSNILPTQFYSMHKDSLVIVTISRRSASLLRAVSFYRVVKAFRLPIFTSLLQRLKRLQQLLADV